MDEQLLQVCAERVGCATVHGHKTTSWQRKVVGADQHLGMRARSSTVAYPYAGPPHSDAVAVWPPGCSPGTHAHAQIPLPDFRLPDTCGPNNTGPMLPLLGAPSLRFVPVRPLLHSFSPQDNVRELKDRLAKAATEAEYKMYEREQVRHQRVLAVS